MAPRKSKQKASSPPSSPAAWEGNGTTADVRFRGISGTDYNQVVEKARHDVNERHRKLADTILRDAKAHAADVVERRRQAVDIDHKAELNAISQQLSADIQVQDEILSQLYDELAVLDKEASDAAKGVLNGLFEMYERHHQEVKKHGEVIQGAYEGEKNAVDALKELVRSMSVSKGEKTN